MVLGDVLQAGDDGAVARPQPLFPARPTRVPARPAAAPATAAPHAPLHCRALVLATPGCRARIPATPGCRALVLAAAGCQAVWSRRVVVGLLLRLAPALPVS